MKPIKLLGSHLSRRQRRVYCVVVVFYVVAFLGMTWPLYTVFNRARPLVLGIPLSLFSLACFVVASFGVLLALYRWEVRQEWEDEP